MLTLAEKLWSFSSSNEEMTRMAPPLLLSVLASAAGARVLVTPPGPTASPTRAVLQADSENVESLPCSALQAEGEELPSCSCYPWLPLACTTLLSRDAAKSGTVVPTQAPEESRRLSLDDCGATVGGMVIPPDSCQGGYYGHDDTLSPESVLKHGLHPRGSDWDLIHHAEQAGNSAFRGTTKLVTYPGGGGASAWADEGGFVYEITCVPSWDVNKHLQGRRMISDLAVGKQRFGGNLVLGEHEHAIPARVPPEHIKRYGTVVTSVSGVPFVPRSSWVDNPHWNPCYCRYSLSDCEDVPCH